MKSKIMIIAAASGGLALGAAAGGLAGWKEGRGYTLLETRPIDGVLVARISVDGEAAENFLAHHPGVQWINGRRFLTGQYKMNLHCLEGERGAPAACELNYTPSKP